MVKIYVMEKNDVANFFWVGQLTFQEFACFNSFLKNGFTVNIWTYDNELQDSNNYLKEEEFNIKNAEEILPSTLLRNFYQGRERGSISSFSNLFRYQLLIREGGWWFDADCFCIKNIKFFQELTKNKDFVLCKEYEDHVGSSVMFFNNKSTLLEIQKEAQLRTSKKSKLFWGEIGPNMITDVLKKEGVYDQTVDSDIFFGLKAKNFKDLYSFDTNKLKVTTDSAFSIHLWNEISRKLLINKDKLPPKKSFLYQIYKPSYSELNLKKYSFLFYLRFLPFFNITFKILFFVKIKLKNLTYEL